MAQTDAGFSVDEEPLKDIFSSAMKIFDAIENEKEPMSSDPVQMSIKIAISKLEKATNLVSISGMFSRNESLDELPTDTLQYLLLPAILGTLTLKITHQSRKDVINVAEIYFRDYLQRCKDYGVTDIEVPSTSTSSNISDRSQSELAKITNLVQTRESKIKRYKEMKELKEKLSSLSKAMASTTDEDIKREYFTTMLQSYVNQALDELNSIEQEKPILEYMAKHSGGGARADRARSAPRPLRPLLLTRDAAQKAVFGAGYPALPALTVQEFYEQRVRDGTFPSSGTNIPHTTIETADNDDDEADNIRKEVLEETDDPEERARQESMDEYKDEHRRGWGNRHNRS